MNPAQKKSEPRRQAGRRPRRTFETALLVALCLLWSPPAEAYIDPGTGSALIYVITGVVVSAYFLVRSLYYRVIEWVLRARYPQQHCDLAIHSETPRYEITFMPILRALSSRGARVTYFTMYARDASFEPLPEGVTHQVIDPGMVGYAYLNHMTAKVLVTTTPQLDVLTFRRSKKVGHYCFVQHALGDARFHRPYAYDFFDSVLCCGELLKQNIRRIEALRGLPAKTLFETGIPHYDELLKHAETAHPRPEAPLILVAPSWGPLSIFEVFGTQLVRRIAERFPVVVRPHPQMKISQPELYAEILALPGVEVDTARTPASVMARADLLVSDISGIAHEFAFIHEKPVIIIDHPMDYGGLEGHLLGGESELKLRCRDFIVPLPPAEAHRIAAAIDDAWARHSRERLVEVRGTTVYNFSRASETAAEQLMGILRCQ